MAVEEIAAPTNKAEMLALVQLWRGRLDDALARFTPEQMLSAPHGGWSVKDILAHVAAWEQILLRYHMGGESFAAATGLQGMDYKSGDWDAINARIYDLYQARSLPDVLAFYQDSYRRLLSALQALPEEELQRETGTGVQPGSILDWIGGNTYGHYAEHIEMLQNLDM